MPRPRRRRPALGPAIVLAAVLVGGGLYSALQDDDGESPPARPPIEPSDVQDGPATPPPLDDDTIDALDAYRVVYRVESYGEQGSIVDTEVRVVRRPFEARAETRAGAPPGDEVTTLNIWAFGVTEIGAVEQERATLVGEPVLPNGEVGLTTDLAEAADAGVLVYLEQHQEIAGRRCHRYRTGGPVDVVRLTAPTSTDFADLCIDEAGLVLGESWAVGGQLFRRRTAVEVDLGVAIAEDAFEPLGRPPSFADGGGLIGEVTADSQFPDVDHWALPEPPDRFRFRGRFSFTPAAAGTAASELGQDVPIVTGLVDVYEDGPDAVLVVNGGTDDESDPLGPLDGEQVDLGDLGTGSVRRRVGGVEILVALDRGRFVKLVGTGTVAELAAIGRGLVRLDGAGKTITADPGAEVLPGPEPD